MKNQIKEGELYQERTQGVKYPRIIRIRKVAKMGPGDYVFFMAENQVAQAAHPNGGFIPIESFLDAWKLAEPGDQSSAPKKDGNPSK
jgi:hypothetical protein